MSDARNTLIFFEMAMMKGLGMPWQALWRSLRLGGLALAFTFAGCASFDAQGHRGARGLEPENTLPAFERALSIGVTTLELDIGVTADGVVVISHDPYLNPLITRDAAGQWLPGARGPLLKNLTLAQLRGYDVGRIRPDTPYAKTFASQRGRDGVRIPTLAELFGRVHQLGASNVRFNIETKINPAEPDATVGPQQMAQALLDVIHQSGMQGRVSIQSFDWRTLQHVQGSAPHIPTVYLSLQSANTDTIARAAGLWTAGLKLSDHGSVPKMVKAAGGRVWSPNGGAVNADNVREAQAIGLKVIPWTINTVDDMRRLMDWGVDGLITDYPDRLRALMQERAMPLPAPVAPAPAAAISTRP